MLVLHSSPQLSTALHYPSTGSPAAVGRALALPRTPSQRRIPNDDAPQRQNLISWSQCVLSVYQTAVTLANFRHILLENHELAYGPRRR